MKYYIDFLKRLETRIAPVYLFHGDEVYLHPKAVGELEARLIAAGTADFDLTVLDGEEYAAADMVRAVQTMPVFNPKRLTVIRRATFLARKGRKTGPRDEAADAPPEPRGLAPLLRYLEAPLASACLVFCVPGPVHKGRKVYKLIAAHGEVVDFKLIGARDTARWLSREARRAGKRFAPGALARLQEWAPPGLEELSRELDKVLLHAGEAPEIRVSDVEAVVTPTREQTIFDVVDAVGMKRGAAALEGIRGLLSAGEPPPKILVMLARQFRLLACAHDLAGGGLPERRVAAQLGIMPFVLRKLRRQMRHFTAAQARAAWTECLEIDAAVKTGRREFLPAVTDMLIRISATDRPGR